MDFLKEKGELIGEWSNVYDHCFTEGLVANIVGDFLALESREKVVLIKAALLHDWYKKKEREAADKFGAQEYDNTAREGAKLLREFGYSEEVILLTGSVGHASLKELLSGGSFLQHIMYYIDNITWRDKVTSLDERMDQLESADRYRELNELGRKIFNGRTYFEVQRELGHNIENEIASRIGIKPNDIPKKIQGVLREIYQIES